MIDAGVCLIVLARAPWLIDVVPVVVQVVHGLQGWTDTTG